MLDLRVLLVEDDPDTAEMVAIVVEGLGCSCEIARTCAAARVLITTQAHDLVILDEHLQDGTGLELARLLRSSARPVYILAFSGTRATDDEFDAHILKPASAPLLRECVQRAAAALERQRSEQ